LAIEEVVEMREPPFKVGGIVEPPYFVGRESELKKLTCISCKERG
jgi:hypothetical protein